MTPGPDTLSPAGLALSIVLPWMTGINLARGLLHPRGRYNGFTLVGDGYFLGLFLTVLLIRLGHAVGMPFGFHGPAALLALIALSAMVLQYWRGAPVERGRPVSLPGWARLTIGLLLLLLAWRYFTMLQEMLLRPLFAWDAWMNWAPRAIVWFEQGALVDFVHPDRWLLQPPGEQWYTLGNMRASDYPSGLPLIQLWTMWGAGTTDHSLLSLPWWLAAVCVGASLYGHLRLAGSNPVVATTAVYVLLSLPYLNAHTVLWGYADIWLMAAFCLAQFALYQWWCTGHRSHALLAVIFAAFCTQLKVPGIVLGAIAIAALARDRLSPGWKWELGAICVAVVLIVGLMAAEVDLSLPGIGRLALDGQQLVAPAFGEIDLGFHPVQGAFVETLFLANNWHILWYLLALLPALLVATRQDVRRTAPMDVASLLGLAFLLLVFFFTEYHRAAENFVTLNRAVLYLVPGLVFSAFVRLSGLSPGKQR